MGLSACGFNVDAPYDGKDTYLEFETPIVTDTYAQVSVRPNNSKTYYYYQVKSTQEIEAMHLTDEQFMNKCLDSLYANYEYWKSIQEKAKVAYIADFASYSLKYGNDLRAYVALWPNTEYQFLGFCVDKNSHKPLGALQRQTFHTATIDSTYISPMVMDFSVDMPKNNTTFEVTMRPTDKGKTCPDPYFYTLISEEILKRDFNDDPEALVETYEDLFYTDRTHLKAFIFSGIKSVTKDIEQFHPETRFVAIAAAFGANWRERLYYLRFEYKQGTSIPFSHDD